MSAGSALIEFIREMIDDVGAVVSGLDGYQFRCAPGVSAAVFDEMKCNASDWYMAPGARGSSFHGIPIVIDPACEPGTIYLIHKDETTPIEVPE